MKMTYTRLEEVGIAFNQHGPMVLCFQKWFERMKKCLKCNEIYFEKQKIYYYINILF